MYNATTSDVRAIKRMYNATTSDVKAISECTMRDVRAIMILQCDEMSGQNPLIEDAHQTADCRDVGLRVEGSA